MRFIAQRKIKQMPVRKLKMGGAFDFFKVLRDVGQFIQRGIDTVAPITSKLVGPITTALTGVSVPNPSDVISQGPSTLLPTIKAIGEKNLDNPQLSDKVKDLMRSALGKGVKR